MGWKKKTWIVFINSYKMKFVPAAIVDWKNKGFVTRVSFKVEAILQKSLVTYYASLFLIAISKVSLESKIIRWITI